VPPPQAEDDPIPVSRSHHHNDNNLGQMTWLVQETFTTTTISKVSQKQARNFPANHELVMKNVDFVPGRKYQVL